MNNNDTQPLMVSIWCLTYNHEPYIRQCLEGFVMQKTNFCFEAVVHDDASTDGTATIVREYAEKYPDIIKPIFETENQYSKNDGSLDRIFEESCKGKYIALCEGDDYWIDPLKLQKQVNALESHIECTIAYCRVRRIRKDGKLLKSSIPLKDHIKEGIITFADFCSEEFGKGHWCFHTSSFLIRKDFITMSDEYLDFTSRFPYGDMPLQLWCLLHGKGYFIDSIGSCYRILSGGYNSMIRANPDFAISQEQKLIKAMRFLDEYTNGTYQDEISMRVLRSKFNIEVWKSNYRILFTRDYWPILKQLPVKRLLYYIVMFIRHLL